MIQLSSSAVLEVVPKNVTSDVEKPPLDMNFPAEAILKEPNQMHPDLTSNWPINGTTAELCMQFAQYLLRGLPKLPTPHVFFRAMQKWEGHVTDVRDDSFIAILSPILGEGPDQEAEILIEDVSLDDRPLIEPGAVFYWSIGYQDQPQRTRVSLLRFRRLPIWNQRDLDTAKRKASILKAVLEWLVLT